MKTFMSILIVLAFPLMILNVAGGIMSAIWLGILGEWWVLLTGICILVISNFILTFILSPSIGLSLLSNHFFNKNNNISGSGILIISNLYTLGIISIWCCLMFFIFVDGATPKNFIPLLIWSYGIATVPWSYFASQEEEPSGSMIATLFLQFGYLTVMCIAIWGDMSILLGLKIIGSFMLVSLFVQLIFTFRLQKEKENQIFEEPLF